MKAIIIGATGATGKALVNQLLNDEKYLEIHVLIRKPSFTSHPKLTEHLIDFDRLDSYTENIKGDVAFSVLGTTLKDAGSKDAQWKVDYDYQYQFAENCKKNGIKTFVLMSAMGADSRSKFFYNKLKGKLEDAIKQLDFHQLIILQPGLLIRPDTKRTNERIFANVLKSLNNIGLLTKYKPQPVENIALAMRQAILLPTKGTQIYTPKEINNLIK